MSFPECLGCGLDFFLSFLSDDLILIRVESNLRLLLRVFLGIPLAVQVDMMQKVAKTIRSRVLRRLPLPEQYLLFMLLVFLSLPFGMLLFYTIVLFYNSSL